MATIFREPLLAQGFARRVVSVELPPNILLLGIPAAAIVMGRDPGLSGPPGRIRWLNADTSYQSTVVLRAVVGSPFSQKDWPAPTKYQYMAPTEVPPNNLASTHVPFDQTEWPYAYGFRFVPANDPPQNILLRGIPLPAPVPFNQTDWQAPFRARFIPNVDIPFNIRSQVGGVPFNQDDWFTVYRPRFVASDILLNLALTNAPAFSPAWNDPATPEYRRAALQVDLPQNSALLAVVVPAPFSQNDWTPAQGWRSAQQAEVIGNILVRGIPSTSPFRETQWPSPFKARYIAFEIPNNLMNVSLSPPPPPPVGSNNPPLPSWPRQVFVNNYTIQQK